MGGRRGVQGRRGREGTGEVATLTGAHTRRGRGRDRVRHCDFLARWMSEQHGLLLWMTRAAWLKQGR